MTVSAAPTRVVVTLPPGATNTTFGFDYLNVSYIDVYYDGVLKVLGLDYTISDKTVTFTPALTVQTVVSIISDQPYGNPFNYENPEQFVAANVNESLDRLTIQINQVHDSAILVGPFSPTIPIADLLAELQEAVSDAEVAATEASTSAIVAQAWAESPTDPIPGSKSAKTWAEIAEGMVIPPNTITTAMLQDNSVTAPKIAAQAVTPAKLSNGFFNVINGLVSVGTGSEEVRGFAIPTDNPNQRMVHFSSTVTFTTATRPLLQVSVDLTTLPGINFVSVVNSTVRGSVSIEADNSGYVGMTGGLLSLDVTNNLLIISFYAPTYPTAFFPRAWYSVDFLINVA